MTNKKVWAQPELTILGTVETLTLATKALGPSDGFVFNNPNTPIKTIS